MAKEGVEKPNHKARWGRRIVRGSYKLTRGIFRAGGSIVRSGRNAGRRQRPR